MKGFPHCCCGSSSPITAHAVSPCLVTPTPSPWECQSPALPWHQPCRAKLGPTHRPRAVPVPTEVPLAAVLLAGAVGRASAARPCPACPGVSPAGPEGSPTAAGPQGAAGSAGALRHRHHGSLVESAPSNSSIIQYFISLES